MASFLGIGAGILYGRAHAQPPFSLFPLLIFAIVALTTVSTIQIQIRSSDEIFFGIEGNHSADTNFLVLPLFVMLTTVTMAALSMRLGRLLSSAAPLRVYAIDIVGSMAGVAAFSVLSALETPPPVWLAVMGLALVAARLGQGISRGSLLNGVLILATIGVSFGSTGPLTWWSPYYRITETADGQPGIYVNGIPHQAMLDVSLSRPDSFYDQVYRWFPGRAFPHVLVIGAGTGNDVAMALRMGAASVDAVEIDPRILRLGMEQHPNRPYDDPRAHPVVNDGRAFLQSTTNRYDLVVFALPDSLTLVSTSANLRLESFLFTVESMASVPDHQAPDGIFVMYNIYRESWLVDKLAGMARTAFGTDPIVRRTGAESLNAAILADGPLVAGLKGAAPPGDRVDSLDPAAAASPPQAATDDWPFLYLRTESLPVHYLVALAIVLGWALLVVARGARQANLSMRRFSPHFFILGVAFLLLETRSLVTFSLLFGTTWLVNALVFFAILASVLLAIGISARVRLRRRRWLYAVLLVTIALAWLLPPGSLLISPPWLRYVVASVIAFLPVFLANLVFSYSFRDTKAADLAFASNLLGAMVGGTVEYLALITGYQALLVVLALLYVLAYVLSSRVRLMADQDLVRADAPIAPPSSAPLTAAD
jgi:SAM-dependent methyltransferase